MDTNPNSTSSVVNMPAETSPVVMSSSQNVVDLNSVVNVSPQDKSGSKKFWIIVGLLVTLGTIGVATYAVQRQSFTQSKAWNCTQYTFNVDQNGVVTVTNNSNENESEQQAEVSINDILVSTLVVPAIAQGASATLGVVSVPTDESFTWSVEGTVDCDNAGSYTVDSSTTADSLLSCENQLDIAMVIDRSSSMRQTEADGRKKLEWAKEAAIGLVQAVQDTGETSVRMSVVSFGAQGNDGTGVLGSNYNSTLNIALTNNYTSIINAINSVAYIESGTCIECGLRIGNGQLTTSANRRVEILLSDGRANHNWNGSTANSTTNAINMSNTGRAAGIEYRVLGYGVSDQINEPTLISIAGGASNYQYKPDVTDWSSSLLTILQDICEPEPTPTEIPSVTVTPNPSETSTPTPTGSPSATPTNEPTDTPEDELSNTPTPTIAGSAEGAGDTLADAGFSGPTWAAFGMGIFLVMGALLLAL